MRTVLARAASLILSLFATLIIDRLLRLRSKVRQPRLGGWRPLEGSELS